MLLNLFNEMRAAKVPVSLRELLDLIGALEHKVVFADMDEFYYLARAILVKDERHFDKFDRAFSAYFDGLQNLDQHLEALIPEEWLRKEFERSLSDEERAQIQSLGGLDKLIEEFKKRLEEQKKRHAGGNKWIGTGGTSPFGSGGYNPEGIRVGDAGERQGKAVKVWDQREYRNLDDSVEIGTRNIKVALRRLRKFARQGAQDELDLDGTIDHTARDGGLLNIQMRPERRNTVKLLLLFDIGGSMDAHVKVCEELFSACRTEFKHMEYFYFHNCVYESVWKNNQRRTAERISTHDLLHKYGADYKVVFIGVHLPAYLVDQHLPAIVGTTVLALVGLFNVFGTYIAGWLGGRRSKPRLLSALYLARGVVIALFISVPLTIWTAYAFGIAMGLLWLSTVPLTNGTVATLFGVRNLSMLGGIVFLFHQLGSFMGGWLGGYLYDHTGSYDLVWQISILLSVVAAALNWPVREQPVARLQGAQA